MVHGPCGGVLADGRCELGGANCAFLETEIPDFPEALRAPLSLPAQEMLSVLDRRALVVVDLPAVALRADDQRAIAAVVAGQVDAALLGDTPWARVQLPPTLRATIVAQEGVRPWPCLTCRDRNRVALEAELAGLAAVGAPAVHCVTGDHPALGHRPDAQPVFDLDSTRLTALAATSGMVVSVAESPSAPPRHERPNRVVAKADAGAGVCFVNHAGDPDELRELVAAVRDRRPLLRFIACVPFAASSAGLERLASFMPGRAVPAELVRALEGDDPMGAAVRTAVGRAEALLDIDGVHGIDLSAAAGPGEELALTAGLALAAGALGGGA
jgi:5,10-methylenetetrahydrofolate reductase